MFTESALDPLIQFATVHVDSFEDLLMRAPLHSTIPASISTSLKARQVSLETAFECHVFQRQIDFSLKTKLCNKKSSCREFFAGILEKIRSIETFCRSHRKEKALLASFI